MVQRSGETASVLKEEGVVESISQRKAVVRIQSGGRCQSCGSREACGVSGGRAMQIDLDNELGAKVGDRVEVSLPTRSLMKLAFLIYFLPVLALILGAYLGKWMGNEILHIESDIAPIISGAVAMALAFLGLRLLDRRLHATSDFRPRMTRILLSVSTSGAVDSK
jgi:sigma-E factor negative regulatory protein RseC